MSIRKHLKYAIDDECADYTAKNIRYNELGCGEFTIVRRGEELVDISLNVPGRHNILNSLAVCAATDFFRLGMDAVKSGLESFGGTKRRFERIGQVRGCEIIDDYAHHPTEIEQHSPRQSV